MTVLFASILLYSAANLANGFVHDVTSYAVLRFVDGVGLAGELGAGITVVTETIPTRLRSVAPESIALKGALGTLAVGRSGDALLTVRRLGPAPAGKAYEIRKPTSGAKIVGIRINLRRRRSIAP